MTTSFRTYPEAFNAACDMARAIGHDVGLENLKSYEGTPWRIFSLPKLENRYGFEARCEVVSPTTPKSGV